MTRPSPRHTLLFLAACALLWALLAALTGGVVFQTPIGRVSARSWDRPITVAIICIAWYGLQFRRVADSELRAAARLSWPRIIATAAAVAAFTIGVRWGTFVASSADASGYVSQASLWRRGVTMTPLPEWVAHATWPDAAVTAAPLGYRPSPDAHTLVPTYAPGLPLLMAAFERFGGDSAAFFVVPLLGAVSIAAVYSLGAMLASPWVGTAAAILLLTSPVFLFMLVQPMGDVPIVALWTLALVAAIRGGVGSAALAGTATSLALLVRPNLLPLAAIVGVVVILRSARETRVARVIGFSATALIGVCVIAALNAHWYGGPLRSGYGTINELYAASFIGPNLARYTRWLVESETPLILLFLAAPLFRVPWRATTAVVAVVVLGFPFAVLALYLLYNTFEEWWYLRFLLPAFPSMVVGLAVVTVAAASLVLPRRSAAVIATLALAAVASRGIVFARNVGVFDMRAADERYIRAAEFTTRLPTRSVFVGVVHTGSLHYYAQRDVLRWEALDRTRLDEAVHYLRGRGYSVYLIAEGAEVQPFRDRFQSAQTLRDLDAGDFVALPGGVVIYPLGGSARPPAYGIDLRSPLPLR